MARRDQDFQTIRSEGGLLPSDLLRRALDPRANLAGTKPEDYGLPPGERLTESITQSWNRLRKHWAEFRAAAAGLGAGEAGTGLTNDKWSLPLLRELGFGLLPTTAGPEVGGRAYAISRFFGPVPVHLVGCGLSLDRRAAGQRGAAVANPHGLVQEFLNRSPDHLWAIVGNGLRLRVLRDNQALSRQSFLEFDLEAMFQGELYSDFVLLWLMVHATRFAPRDGDRPESCWLEQWSKDAEEQGTRALEGLRSGVEKALLILGEGFTSHPRNTALRELLRTGKLPLSDFHGQLLRVVYRLIFLFVSEDRTLDGQPLLHPRDESDGACTARERFAAHYGTGRLRELAGKIKGSRHSDLWRQFQLVVGALSGNESSAAIRRHLGLPALGSFLWSTDSTAALNGTELTNHDFLEALRHLAFTRQGKVLRPVDYKNLGAEELGGVYESLLALTPQISADGARFTFAEFAGNERRTSGSYYTPDSLVQCLLDSALDPVVEEALKGKTGGEAEGALLALKVCDPAVGSGHFLVGAAHRLARHLARVRAQGQGESEPSPLLYQHALRDVIGRCVYGVDVSPMAAELCRVSLWLEALEPGKPLSFLDHHIRVGNSLLGATPELIGAGLPDEAFTVIEGDDKKACAVLKKRNRTERKGHGPLFAQQDAETQARLQKAAAELEALPDDQPEDIRAKELAFRQHEGSDDYYQKKRLADTLCAAFVIQKHFREPGREASATGITQRHLNDLANKRGLPEDLAKEAERLSLRYQFFHWHLAFPEVSARGGFDVVLGNPPWERVKLQEKEWFAERSPEIANAPNAAARKRLIEALKASDPRLHRQFIEDSRIAEGESHLMRNSCRYPLCGRGDINVYAVFAEGMRQLIRTRGRVGCIVPTGIATDDTTKYFFADVVASGSLVSLFDFSNREQLFPAVAVIQSFSLVTLELTDSVRREFRLAFGLLGSEDLRRPEKILDMSREDIQLLSPASGTCPTFSGPRDKALNVWVYRTLPLLAAEGARAAAYALEFLAMFHSSNDSGDFVQTFGRPQSDPTLLQLYEAKYIQQYDHRHATFEGVPPSGMYRVKAGTRLLSTEEKRSPIKGVVPRYMILGTTVVERMSERWPRRWMLAFRKTVQALTNARCAVFSILPYAGVTDKAIILLPRCDVPQAAFLLGNLNSFAFDYLLQQKLGSSGLSNFVLSQIPVVTPLGDHRCTEGVMPRVLELTFTAWDLEAFAKDCGWSGAPFRWDEDRRFLLRCELDATFFHLYLPTDASGDWHSAEGGTVEDLARVKASFPTPRDAVAYIMDAFPIVRRKDEEKYEGEYRTKRVILEIYDAMQEAVRDGRPYQTRLDPPPADARCCHPPREESQQERVHG